MSILGLIVSFGLFTVALVVVAHPLLRSRSGSDQDDARLGRQRDRVQVYYERVLTNIRDLDEDSSTGKINEADYHEEREVWVRRGIRLLRMRDQLDARQSLVSGREADFEDIDAAIEAAISSYREGAAPAPRELSQREAN